MSDLRDIAVATAHARRVLTGVREGIAWFRARNVSRDELIKLLDQVDAEGRDLSDIEYAKLAGSAQEAIDRLLASTAPEAPVVVAKPVPAVGKKGVNSLAPDDGA